MDKKETIEYWNKIKVGSIIQLDDTQTLEFLINEGMTVSSNGADFEVVRLKELSLNDDSVKIKLAYIQLKDIVWYLTVWNVEGEIKLKVYYEPDWFNVGSREDMLENEYYHLFEAPDDEENVIVEDLSFATTILEVEVDEEEDEEVEVVYNSFLGVMYGSSIEDGEEDFATVVDLFTEDETEDTDLLIIELCNATVQEQLDEDGYTDGDTIVDIDHANSFVMYLKGCSVELNDVEVLT